MKKVKITLLISLSLFAFFPSCKKKNNNPYSTWYVNGQKFTTNDVKLDVGKMQTDFQTNSFVNGFSFQYSGIVGLGVDGRQLLNCSAPTLLCFGIYYNDTEYIAKTDHPHYINQATIRNGLTQYTLDTTWLFNNYNFLDSVFKDSVLVYGVFNMPFSD